MTIEDQISHVAAFPVVDMTDVEEVFHELARAAYQVSRSQQAVVALAQTAIEFHDEGKHTVRDETIVMLKTMLAAMGMPLEKLESFNRDMLAVIRTATDQIRAAQQEAQELVKEIDHGH
jgi:hypothetical protein